MGNVLKRFFVEGDLISAVETGKVKVDPTELRNYAQEKGFESVRAYAQIQINKRNAFIASLNK